MTIEQIRFQERLPTYRREGAPGRCSSPGLAHLSPACTSTKKGGPSLPRSARPGGPSSDPVGKGGIPGSGAFSIFKMGDGPSQLGDQSSRPVPATNAGTRTGQPNISTWLPRPCRVLCDRAGTLISYRAFLFGRGAGWPTLAQRAPARKRMAHPCRVPRGPEVQPPIPRARVGFPGHL